MLYHQSTIIICLVSQYSIIVKQTSILSNIRHLQHCPLLQLLVCNCCYYDISPLIFLKNIVGKKVMKTRTKYIPWIIATATNLSAQLHSQPTESVRRCQCSKNCQVVEMCLAPRMPRQYLGVFIGGLSVFLGSLFLFLIYLLYILVILYKAYSRCNFLKFYTINY